MALTRVLEPEVMETDVEARSYDAMDHAEVNAVFVMDLLAAGASEMDLRRTLDVGTGTALIPIELCRAEPRARVVGVDLAHAMLDLGRRNVERAGFAGAITLTKGDAKSLPFEDDAFSCVVSNTLLHHIPSPDLVLREMLRVLRPGGLLFVRDLVRPPDSFAVEDLVSRHAANADGLARSLFEDSLRASLSVDELRAMISRLGIDPTAVSTTSDRHLTLAYRMPRGK